MSRGKHRAIGMRRPPAALLEGPKPGLSPGQRRQRTAHLLGIVGVRPPAPAKPRSSAKARDRAKTKAQKASRRRNRPK